MPLVPINSVCPVLGPKQWSHPTHVTQIRSRTMPMSSELAFASTTPSVHRQLYLHSEFRAGEARLHEALRGTCPVVVLTGPTGVGKSTLAARAVQRVRGAGGNAVSVVSTHLAPHDLMRILARELGVHDEAEMAGGQLAQSIVDFAKGHRKIENGSLVSIDEAHNLPEASLRAILELATASAGSRPGLRLLLAGADSLPARLGPIGGERLTAHLEMRAASADEVENCLREQLQSIAGDAAPRLSDSAMSRLADASAGVARLMNLLCARVMLYVDLFEVESLELEHVDEILDELRDELMFIGDTSPRFEPELL